MHENALRLCAAQFAEMIAEFDITAYWVVVLGGAKPNSARLLLAADGRSTREGCVLKSGLIEELVRLFEISVLPVVNGRFIFDEDKQIAGCDLERFAAFTFRDASQSRYIAVFEARERFPETPLICLLLQRTVKAIEQYSRSWVAIKTQHLTEREIECLKWSAQGKSSVEIGLILSLSPHTVNSYMQTAVKKLDATNRTHAVAKASEFGLI